MRLSGTTVLLYPLPTPEMEHLPIAELYLLISFTKAFFFLASPLFGLLHDSPWLRWVSPLHIGSFLCCRDV